MRKFLTTLALLLCVCLTLALSATATEDVEKTIQDSLWDLQFSFDGKLSEEYMAFKTVMAIRDESGDYSLPFEKTVAASDFEATLNKYFKVSQDNLQKIKTTENILSGAIKLSYNEAENTYGILVEGVPASGHFAYGYNCIEKTDTNTYDVFYHYINYEYLDSVLPDGVDAFDYAMELGFPETIEYNGKVYKQGESDWATYSIENPQDYGQKYTVEVNGKTVRILSAADYTAKDMPGYEEKIEKMFASQLEFLDTYFSSNLAEYACYEMTSLLVDKEWNDFSDTIIPADVFEETLNKYFTLDSATLATLRIYANYNEAEQTYTLANWGGFGGGAPERAYTGYKENNGLYEVFFSKMIKEYLRDQFDSVEEYYSYTESLGYPQTITYNGVTYENVYGDYESISGYEMTGKKYTVDINGEIVRIHSISTFTEKEHPDYVFDAEKAILKTLDYVDLYYGNNLTNYVKDFMNKLLYKGQGAVDASVYEAELVKYFKLSGYDLFNLRQATNYNSDTKTYAVSAPSAFTGSWGIEREFTAYTVKNGVYEVFYNTLTMENLKDQFNTEEEYEAYVESMGYPSKITYNGKTYKENGYDYVIVTGTEKSGLKYTVDLNGEIVRLHSIETFTEKDHPDYVPTLEEIFQDELWLLNSLYEYGPSYMIKKVHNDLFVEDTFDYSKPTVVSAKVFEDTLNKYFVVTDELLNQVRNYDPSILKYNEAEQTYSLYFLGGWGGLLPPRKYFSYIDNKNETYDVLYKTVNYEFLSAVLPDGVTEDSLAEPLDWPEELTYNGVVYINGPEGYYRIASLENTGKLYRVSINDDYTVRILAVEEFDQSVLPGYRTGDIDGNNEIDSDDAVYLLYNILFGAEDFPMLQKGDFDGDGNTTSDDAIYLLYHVLFGSESYPIAG